MLVTLTATEPEERVDCLLSRSVEGLSRTAAQHLLREGRVCANGEVLKKNARPAPGTELRVDLPEAAAEVPLSAQDIPLDIVYEDADVIVVNKPAGMVVHPAPGHPDGTLVNALLFRCGDSLSGINGELRPGIVHRIDKETSGLVIAAKNDEAHLTLSAQLADHSLARVYECVAQGALPEEAGTISAPIGRHPRDRKKMAVRPDGRPAVTHYEVLARYPGCTYARCRLETGRTHQIRVHMAYIGHPLLGDTVYGGRTVSGLSGQCLHARELSFTHPRTGERITLSSPLPDRFCAVLDRLERGL